MPEGAVRGNCACLGSKDGNEGLWTLGATSMTAPHPLLAVAKMLIEKDCSRGDRVMIAYPFGLEFLAGMLGCMRAGIIPCSVSPPNPSKLSSDIPKFEKFARDAGAKFALSTANLMWLMRGAKIFYSMSVRWLATDNLLPVADFEGVEIDPEDIGFIQYTSGSTGTPKGVMISHRSLLMNAKTIAHMTGAHMETTAAMCGQPLNCTVVGASALLFASCSLYRLA